MSETTQTESKPRSKINWAPYWLILPTLIYLAIFFIWPMYQGLRLSVWDGEANLTLLAEPQRGSADAGLLAQGTQVNILERQGNPITPEEANQPNLVTERWFQVQADTASGSVEGWVSDSRIRVREEDASGNPTAGTVRIKLGGDDPLTSVYAQPTDKSDVVGKLEANTAVTIVDQSILEVWYKVEAQENGQTVQGWAQSRFIQVFGDTNTGRIDRGNSGVLTGKFIEKMVSDRFFWPAIWTTLLLMVLIIPVQFVLAMIMALVMQARLKGGTLFLYIFAIPLGVSELAVGILWFSVFTQPGFLNSLLQGLGLASSPITFLSADTRGWILVAIWIAEVWRATSIVMVIVVSGLQGIPGEVLEAAEVFGAGMWERIRYVILPMLKPSLQVALILRTILALQVFAVVIALSGGEVVTVLANETYRQYTNFRNANVAAAYAALILLMSMVFAIFYLRMIRSQEEMAT